MRTRRVLLEAWLTMSFHPPSFGANSVLWTWFASVSIADVVTVAFKWLWNASVGSAAFPYVWTDGAVEDYFQRETGGGLGWKGWSLLVYSPYGARAVRVSVCFEGGWLPTEQSQGGRNCCLGRRAGPAWCSRTFLERATWRKGFEYAGVRLRVRNRGRLDTIKKPQSLGGVIILVAIVVNSSDLSLAPLAIVIFTIVQSDASPRLSRHQHKMQQSNCVSKVRNKWRVVKSWLCVSDLR